MRNESRRRHNCFLFYVYGFFLGLGCGVISSILAFKGSEPASVASKCLIVAACVLSLVTFIVQLAVACRGERSAGQRSATIVIGLIITAACTVTAVACSPGHKGIFFMLGTFSVVFYLFTVVAFSVSFYRDRKLKRQEEEAEAERQRTIPWTTVDPDLAAELGDTSFPSFDETWENQLTERRGRDEEDEGRRLPLTMEELLQLGRPPIMTPPAYSEVTADTGGSLRGPPPNYSEYAPSSSPPPPPPAVEDAQESPPSYTETEFPILDLVRVLN